MRGFCLILVAFAVLFINEEHILCICDGVRKASAVLSFEAEEQEGGRVQEFIFRGQALELGASIFWDQNLYVKAIAERLGLGVRILSGRRAGRRGGTTDSQSQHRAEEGKGTRFRSRDGPLLGAGEVNSSGGGSSGAGRRSVPSKRDASGKRRDRGFSIWNGTAFVLNMTNTWSDKLHLALRYGTARVRYNWLAENAFQRFRRVYDMQAQGVTWDTPEELLHSLDLYNETQRQCSEYMREWLERPLWWLWGGAEFADEVAGAANRCNYNQNNDQMNALVGLVSYMPMASGSVLQIEGGNRQLVSGLLATASGARLVSGARVTSIRRRVDDGRYFLKVEVQVKRDPDLDLDLDSADKRGQEETEKMETLKVFGPYDAVVIATPLLGSGIQLDLSSSGGGDSDDETDGYETCQFPDGMNDNGTDSIDACGIKRTSSSDGDGGGGGGGAAAAAATALQQPYQVTVTTFVTAGRLRAGYFNVAQVPPVLRVFVTSRTKAPFSSLAVQNVDLSSSYDGDDDDDDGDDGNGTGRGTGGGGGHGGGSYDDEGKRVYKIFSSEELSQELLEDLFESDAGPPRILASRRWYAYPRFQPPERFSPFRLAPGLVYGNALESAAAAMEMAAIAAHNSAALVVRYLEEMRVAERERKEAKMATEEVAGEGATAGEASPID